MEPFRPDSLVGLADGQGHAALAAALARCTRGTPEGRAVGVEWLGRL